MQQTEVPLQDVGNTLGVGNNPVYGMPDDTSLHFHNMGFILFGACFAMCCVLQWLPAAEQREALGCAAPVGPCLVTGTAPTHNTPPASTAAAACLHEPCSTPRSQQQQQQQCSTGCYIRRCRERHVG
jgi:hypothetical protein